MGWVGRPRRRGRFVDAAGPDISTVVGHLQQVFGEVRLTSYNNVICCTGFNRPLPRLEETEIFSREVRVAFAS
jgi:hypothetical protein